MQPKGSTRELKINMGELQLLPNRTVFRVKFCLHVAEECAQEEIFLKSSKSIFSFSKNAREPVLKLLPAATVPDWEPKSQSISSTRVLNNAVLNSAHLIENMFPHSLMLFFPQAHTCI